MLAAGSGRDFIVGEHISAALTWRLSRRLPPLSTVDSSPTVRRLPPGSATFSYQATLAKGDQCWYASGDSHVIVDVLSTHLDDDPAYYTAHTTLTCTPRACSRLPASRTSPCPRVYSSPVQHAPPSSQRLPRHNRPSVYRCVSPMATNARPYRRASRHWWKAQRREAWWWTAR